MKLRFALPVLAAVASTRAADGRTYGSLLAPRRYQYSRSARRDPFDLASEIFSMPVYLNSMMRQQEAEVARLAESVSPRYSVTENSETGVIELAMELPGVSADDLAVELVDNKVLRISGSRKHIRHGSTVTTDFDQTFQLDKDVDAERLEVKLSAGILTVTAPKREKIIKRLPVHTEDNPAVLFEPKKIDTEETKEGVVEAEVVVEDVDGLSISEE